MSKKVLYRVTVFGVDLIFLLFLYLNTKNILNYVLETNDITIPFAIAISTVFIKSLGYILLGNYQMLWMYTNKGNFVRLCINYIVTSISCLILWFISSKFNFIDLQSQALLICLLIEFCYLTVSRFALAYYFDNVYSVGDRSKLPTKRKRTLIVGAGSAGCMVFKEICAKKEYGYNVLGFLDDSDDKIGSMINGIKVYDKVDEVCQYVDKLNIEEVIIAIPSASKHRIQSVINKVVKSNANVQIIPDKSMLLTSNISDSMRKVSIDDLLGREQVVLDIEGINDFINNKVILVTGGGGSIGSEICRQVLKYNPKKLVVFDIYENSIYDLQMELNQIYKSENRKINYEMVIGSVRDKNRLEEIFKEYKPNIVFHAAAHKHVPLMEVSPKESFKNNVMGTYNVGFCADKYKIEKWF